MGRGREPRARTRRDLHCLPDDPGCLRDSGGGCVAAVVSCNAFLVLWDDVSLNLLEALLLDVRGAVIRCTLDHDEEPDYKGHEGPLPGSTGFVVWRTPHVRQRLAPELLRG